MAYNQFRELRENIEVLIEETNLWIKKKSISESSKRIDSINDLLVDLKLMVDNDVQERVIKRLTGEIELSERRIEEILSKRESGKKQDGNIAFKCNWNDKHYWAPCSDEAYAFNVVQGRAWCSCPLSKCRTYNDDVTLDDHPCYESIALKEMFFAAGWDVTGEQIKFRKIHHARTDRMAILTTRPPGTSEKDRIIIGCLYIERIEDDPGMETKIYGDKKKSVEIDYDNTKIYFWDYYKNPDAEDKIFWGTGLFRYITNGTVLSMLKDIGEKNKNADKDVSGVIDLIKYYEKLAMSNI